MECLGQCEGHPYPRSVRQRHETAGLLSILVDVAAVRPVL